MADPKTTQASSTAAENAALREALAQAQAALAALKAKGQGRISCKVSEKGALSVYGMGRFPVTLYRGQWERLLSAEVVEQIKGFIRDNAARLATKD